MAICDEGIRDPLSKVSATPGSAPLAETGLFFF
jgi:hypothetical protein